MTWYLITAYHDLLEQSMGIGITKWQMPTQHSKQYDTAAPNIRIERVIIPLSLDHLRRRITRRPTKSLQLVLLIIKRPKSKIYDLELLIVID